MESIKELCDVLRIVILSAGAVRLTTCCVMVQMDADVDQIKKRALNVVLFTIFAVSFTGFLPMILGYFT